jgi:hypothetical protein
MIKNTTLRVNNFLECDMCAYKDTVCTKVEAVSIKMGEKILNFKKARFDLLNFEFIFELYQYKDYFNFMKDYKSNNDVNMTLTIGRRVFRISPKFIEDSNETIVRLCTVKNASEVRIGFDSVLEL